MPAFPPPGDAEVMAARIVQMLENDELRQRMGMQAAEDAKQRFDLEGMAKEYLDWYGDIINIQSNYLLKR